MSVFLQEEVAEAMISQIDGFDPKAQPLAFEETLISETSERNREVGREIAESVFPDRGTRPKEAESKTPMHSTWMLEWVAASCILAAIVWWLKKRSAAS